MSDKPMLEIVQHKQMYRDTNTITPNIKCKATVPANITCHSTVAIMNYCKLHSRIVLAKLRQLK